MKNTTLNNKILFARMKKLVSVERSLSIEILECLYEIERRKAYAELRYDGLYTYCVKELGFTESQAYQRIQAMRALKELPELKPLIESGSLSVASISKVQTHLKKQKKKKAASVPSGWDEKAEKLELFQSMENRTSREVDQKLAEVRGEKLKEKLVLELDEEAAELWKQVQDLSAHKNQAEKGATFKMLMREWLKRNHPAREVRGEKVTNAASLERSRDSALKIKPKLQTDSRSVPLPLRREIWRRDDGKCTKCESKHALEIDHIHPFALGGKTEVENLRLLCRSCNRHAAIQVFGLEKINSTTRFHKNPPE